MRLTVLRHGQTQGNLERRYVGGATDDPLCEAGRAAAAEVGECPQVKTVFVSPMSRACQTAQILFPNARQIQVEALREMDFGIFEMRAFAGDLEHDTEYARWTDGMCEGVCPGGESRAQFCARTVDGICEVLSQAQELGLEEVVVVAHGGTVMAAFDGLCDGNRSYFDWHVGNCGGYGATVVCDESGAFGLKDPFEATGLHHLRN